jgi:tetratricopeptide (TPR) repeat protein
MKSLQNKIVVDEYWTPDFRGINCADYLKSGTDLLAVGELKQALDIFTQGLNADPRNYELLIARGDVLHRLAVASEALSSYKFAIATNPNRELGYLKLGYGLLDSARFEEAYRQFQFGLLINPANIELLKGIAKALIGTDKHSTAKGFLARAAMLDLEDPEAPALIARIYFLTGDFERANIFARRSLSKDAQNKLGLEIASHALHELQDYRQAAEYAETLVTLFPDQPNFHTIRSIILHKASVSQDALDGIATAINLDPTPERLNNRGIMCYETRDFDTALESYDQALALDPDSVDVNWNKSLLLLLQGNYEEGWPLYEWRLKREETSEEYPQFTQPLWRGETDLRGQRLLVHVEQGLGDMVQFCRYIPILADKGIEVILQVQASLLPLIESLESDVTLVSQDDPLPDFDAYCPLMSLPYALGTTLETIPSSDAYLSPCPKKVADWHEKLGSTDALRVGLVWSGRKEHKNDHNRSMALADLLPVLDVPVEWHSIQKDYRAADLAVLKTLPELHQHQSDLADFSDTAALLENLDLVITVDTSVAHVAAALGKPTWLLLPYLCDFRWLMDREDTPWYPSMRLYRQEQPGDWAPVLERIKSDLGERVNA